MSFYLPGRFTVPAGEQLPAGVQVECHVTEDSGSWIEAKGWSLNFPRVIQVFGDSAVVVSGVEEVWEQHVCGVEVLYPLRECGLWRYGKPALWGNGLFAPIWYVSPHREVRLREIVALVWDGRTTTTQSEDMREVMRLVALPTVELLAELAMVRLAEFG